MKVIAKKNRELTLINAQNTQNENRAETITLVVPEEYEDYNKKIVFITPNGNVWDVITNNEYKITNAITKYKDVDFYIWLTKEVNGETIDFRTKTRPLKFYHNEDASDEITPEEISGVTTVINLLEEEITKVENLDLDITKVGNTATVTLTDKNGVTKEVEINDGQDGYTPQKGTDYFTEQDIEEIETDVKEDVLDEVYTKSETDTLLEEKADTTDIPDVSNFITKDVNNLTNYTLKTNTGSLIDLEINDTTYVVTLKLKNQDGTIISTDTIDLPLESVVVSGRYDNTTKKVILTLENGSEVDFSVADLVAGLQTEITSSNKLASDLVDDTNSGNKFVTTSEKQTWNGKYDKPNGGIPKTDLASTVQTSLNKADTAIQEHQDISGKEDKTNKVTSIDNTSTDTQYPSAKCVHDSQAIQDDEIEALQTENARLKATLPTTTGEGEDITLNKTAEMEFVKPPLPIGNSEQNTTTGTNLIGLDTEQCKVNLTSGDKLTITNNTSEEIKMDLYSNYGDTQGNDWYSFVANDTRTITLLHDTKAIAWRNAINGIAWCNLGETALTYEIYTNGASPNPDYPQTITNVTGNVEVDVQNKNLLDISQVIIGRAWNAGSNSARAVVYIKCKPSTTYTISFNSISNFDGVYNFEKTSPEDTSAIIGVSQITATKTITTNASSSYLGIQFNKSNISLSDFEGLKMQIEEKSISTDYVPHKSQNLPLTLGNIELCKIGDYQDEFIKQNEVWKIPNKILKIDSYNGETITTPYISTTGGLDTGATVYYVGTSDLTITDTTLISQLEAINNAISYEEKTNISSNGIALFNVEVYLNTKEKLNELDDLKLDHPEFESTGTSLSLEGAGNNFELKLNIKGNNSQSAEPSFASPSNVNIVDGTYQIKVANSDNSKYQNILIDTSTNPLYSDQDYYIKENEDWYVYNKFTKINDFSELGVAATNTTGKNRFTLVNNNLETNNTDTTLKGKSNVLSLIKSGRTYACDEGFNVASLNSKQTLFIYADNMKQLTANEAIQYLNSKSAYFILPLITPTRTKITNSNLINSLEALQDLRSYYSETNITQTHQSGQADIKINAKALMSMKYLQTEIEELQQAILNS